jgi:hypothetical protein
MSYVRRDITLMHVIQVYCGFNLCPSVLETVTSRVPIRYLRDFSLFRVALQL